MMFQSTHPARGATSAAYEDFENNILFQSTHPARGATQCAAQIRLSRSVSIHAPRAGCDSTLVITSILPRLFQSTHPARGATRMVILWPGFMTCFNPRTPRGVRHPDNAYPIWHCSFQSTHPARGATHWQFPSSPRTWVSIHAPRAGCDMRIQLSCPLVFCFNPRTPRGVRPDKITWLVQHGGFQSTHPARGATSCLLSWLRSM